MPDINFEQVRRVFSFLEQEMGFNKGNHKTNGTEKVIEYAKNESTLVIVGAGDMGAGFPFSHIHLTSESGEDLIADIDALANSLGVKFAYPLLEDLWHTWWPRSWYIRLFYKDELNAEYEKRIQDLGMFLQEHFQSIESGNITPVPINQELNVKKFVTSKLATLAFLLMIPATFYVLFPMSNYWQWGLLFPVIHVFLAYQAWKDAEQNRKMSAILSGHRK